MLKVVLDTNVIVSALLTDTGLPALLFDLATSQKFQLFYSPALIDEYEQVLNRKQFDFPKDKTKRALEEIKRAGIEVIPKQTITLIKEDPQDNRILEAGQEAQADYIITGNKSHFPFANFERTQIVTPREFILREEANIR